MLLIGVGSFVCVMITRMLAIVTSEMVAKIMIEEDKDVYSVSNFIQVYYLTALLLNDVAFKHKIFQIVCLYLFCFIIFKS